MNPKEPGENINRSLDANLISKNQITINKSNLMYKKITKLLQPIK